MAELVELLHRLLTSPHAAVRSATSRRLVARLVRTKETTLRAAAADGVGGVGAGPACDF
jgi:hypothetical protein